MAYGICIWHMHMAANGQMGTRFGRFYTGWTESDQLGKGGPNATGIAREVAVMAATEADVRPIGRAAGGV